MTAPPFKVLLQVLIDLGSIFRQVGAFDKQTILGKMRVQAFKKDSVPRSAHRKTGGMQLQEQLASVQTKMLVWGVSIVSRAARGKKNGCGDSGKQGSQACGTT